MPYQREIGKAQDILLRTVHEPTQFQDTLSSLIGTDPSLERLATMAVALGHPQILVPVIDAFLADTGALAGLNQTSYQIIGRDEGGCPSESFHAITLYQGAEGEYGSPSSQLHIWFPEQGDRLTEDIHDHAPHFASRQLTGAFQDTLYSRTQPGEGERMLEYADLTDQPTGEAFLRARRERVIPAGKGHVMPNDVIHRATLAPQEITATLVVRGPRLKRTGVAFTTQPRQDTGPRSQPIDAAESLRRFRNVFPGR